MPALLITAADPELRAILGAVPEAVFASAENVRAIIKIKPGPMVLVVDAADASMVHRLARKDVRVVVLVTPQQVPMIFSRPVVAVVERPLLPAKVVSVVKLAMAELVPPSP